MKKLTLGFSPCPNDTFIFDALVNGKIDTGDLLFEPVMEDVQTLNEWAKHGKLDISKISYGVLPLILDNYTILRSGGALGMGVGPLLIGPHPASPNGGGESNPDNLYSQVENATIAIPGENTTAHFLFSQAFPKAGKKVFIRFDEIEDFVLSGKGLGVIIHENRFTYQQKGLYKWMDLGEYWEQSTGYPIPLGGIVMKKSFDAALHKQVDALIKKSLEMAFSKYPHLSDYVKSHSQEMSEEVMRQHIQLYVNDFSLDVGEAGEAAIQRLLETMKRQVRCMRN